MSLRGCYDGMCGGCSWCRAELHDCCEIHGVGYAPEWELCELCQEEAERRAAAEEARLDAEDVAVAAE